MKKTEDKRIRTIEQLKEIASKGMDCCIRLNGGLRSSKHIRGEHRGQTLSYNITLGILSDLWYGLPHGSSVGF